MSEQTPAKPGDGEQLDDEILQRMPSTKIVMELLQQTNEKQPIQTTLPFNNSKAYGPANCKGGDKKW
jgi:hypothetical protein